VKDRILLWVKKEARGESAQLLGVGQIKTIKD
jgi:hypothetical protein